jgi:diguanylate cyclase (GGDEF)-like protein/PAS domain S-box-containing protein
MASNRRLVIVLTGCAGLVGLFVAWLIFNWGGETVTQWVDDTGEFVMAFLAAAACWWAALRHQQRTRIAWALIGLSALSWGVGEVFWSYYELLAGQTVPFPSLADLGFLGAVPFAVAGVLFFPSAPSRASSLVRAILDGLLIASSLFIISWATVLGTVYRASSGGLGAQLIGLAYPAGDVVIATMLVILASRASRTSRVPLLLLAGGLLANLLADSGFAYMTTSNTYGTGNPVDAGWLAGYLLIAIAALRAASTPAALGTVNDGVTGRIWLVVPYLPIAAAALVVALEESLSGELDPVVFWVMMAVVLLVVGRQYLMLTDNQLLNRKLEANAVELRQGQEHFRSLVHNSSDVITLIGRDGGIRYQSSSVERILGYADRQLIGTSFGDLVHPDDRTQVLRKIDEAINIMGPPIAVECRLRREDDSYFPTEVTITNLLELPAVRGLVLNTRDVSERKALEEKLTHQAFHDSLTNLPNRAAFRIHLDHALQAEERRIAVLFLDLDDFKAVNDTLGHETGDQLLTAVASRISSTLRPGDSVSRLGGDEFAVLLNDIEDEHTAARVADRIIRQLSPPFVLGGNEIAVHASIGIAGLVTGQEAADEMLRNADIAMYIAKARGKARYVEYEASLASAAVQRMELEHDLLRGLAEKEFVLHYQPVVMLETGAIHSLEALIRWNHPRRGLLYPADFIAIAEQNGAIMELGRWVLQQAARDGRRWQVRYPSTPPMLISVNLSGRQLQKAELLTDVMDAVDAAGLDPQSLVLELTESVLMSDVEGVGQTLMALRSRGVKLALDDFGTGFSSLGHLRDFTVDIVKMDRSFVAGIGSGLVDGAILRAVIGLGSSLGLMTIGEGIERPEQLAALNAMGCHAGQGYHLSRPLDRDAMDALLASCIESASGRQLPPAWRLAA